MKIQLKSGEKKFKFSHKAMFKAEKLLGRPVMEIVSEMEEGKMAMGDIYNLLFAPLVDKYKDIDEFLDDLKDDKMTEYMELLSQALGLLFGGNIKQK